MGFITDKVFFDNPMTSITDGVMIFCITASIIFFEAVQQLLTIFQEGIFVDQRQLLLKKTNKELKAMLVGVKRISNLNKTQLVDLLLEV